jgi:hypothetical protein
MLYPRSVTFSANDRYLATWGPLKLMVHEVATGKSVLEVDAPDLQGRYAMGFSPDGEFFAMTDLFGESWSEPVCWNLVTKAASEITPANIKWNGKYMSPNGRWTRTSGRFGTVHVISQSPGGPYWSFIPEWQFDAIASGFTSDSQAYFVVQDDGMVYIWRLGQSGNGPTGAIASRHRVPPLATSVAIGLRNNGHSIAYVDGSSVLRTVSLPWF